MEDIAGVLLDIKQKLRQLDDVVTTPGTKTFEAMGLCYDLHALAMRAVIVASRDHETAKKRRKQ